MRVYQGVKNTTFLRKFCVRIKWMIPSIFSKTKADLTVKSHKLHDTEEAFRKLILNSNCGKFRKTHWKTPTLESYFSKTCRL